jgi:hypothetical protein
MVNFLSLLVARALHQGLEKRDTIISTFTNAFTTHYAVHPSGAIETATAIGVVISNTQIIGGITYKTVRSQTTIIEAPTPTHSALTTIFTPSAFCFTELSAAGNDPTYVTGATPEFWLPAEDRPECFPEGQYSISYYSPGLCPSGWSIDRMSYTIIVTTGVKATETQAVCCPT